MKRAVIKYLRRFSYPQGVFASAIKPYVDIKAKHVMVDVPCGNGVTSWVFSKIKNLNVYGFDLDRTSIEIAKESFRHTNLKFEIADIRGAIHSHSDAKYFSIINSLFLLPEPEGILKEVWNALQTDGRLFVVLPNVNNKNFKWFEKNNPGVNGFTLSHMEFQDYFHLQKFKLEHVVPIVYARSFRRNDVRFLSILGSFYLKLLNYIQSLFKLGKPNYFLLVLVKNK